MSSLLGKYILNKPLVCTCILQVSSARNCSLFCIIDNDTITRDFSCHAKISFWPHLRVPFSTSALHSVRMSSHSHIPVSQDGEWLPSAGIIWISGVNMWFSTLCSLWLESGFSSPLPPTTTWVQFCAASLGEEMAAEALPFGSVPHGNPVPPGSQKQRHLPRMVSTG